MAENDPKRDPVDNAAKDPDDWVSGGDPMTGAQASYLKTLSEQAHEPGAYEPGLTKAEALKEALRERGAAETSAPARERDVSDR